MPKSARMIVEYNVFFFFCQLDIYLSPFLFSFDCSLANILASYPKVVWMCEEKKTSAFILDWICADACLHRRRTSITQASCFSGWIDYKIGDVAWWWTFVLVKIWRFIIVLSDSNGFRAKVLAKITTTKRKSVFRSHFQWRSHLRRNVACSDTESTRTKNIHIWLATEVGNE